MPSVAAPAGAVNRPALVVQQPAEMVARAKAVLDGRQRPPAMTTPEDIGRYLTRLAADGPPLTDAARRELTDELNLRAHYGGQAVICARTADGWLTVLARGAAEMRAVLAGLSAAEKERVWTKHPERLALAPAL